MVGMVLVLSGVFALAFTNNERIKQQHDEHPYPRQVGHRRCESGGSDDSTLALRIDLENDRLDSPQERQHQGPQPLL